MARVKFFVVQPWGRDKAHESTIVYEAETADEAFAEIERIGEVIGTNGERPDLIELMVVDWRRNPVVRRVS